MRLGLGISFYFLAHGSLLADPQDQSVVTHINRLRGQDVSEQAQLAQIQSRYAQLEDLSLEEAKTLIAPLAKQLAEIERKLKNQDLSSEDRTKLREEGRAVLADFIAVVLRTPNLAIKMERWLEVNRKTYFFLSEVFVVAAAILGAEYAFKDSYNVGLTVAATFGIGLAAAAAVIFPARWWWRKAWNDRMTEFSSSFLTKTEWVSLMELARELRFPLSILKCTDLLIQVQKPRLPTPHP